jgi:glycosyltransferase involved in cell wall biosynthesis
MIIVLSRTHQPAVLSSFEAAFPSETVLSVSVRAPGHRKMESQNAPVGLGDEAVQRSALWSRVRTLAATRWQAWAGHRYVTSMRQMLDEVRLEADGLVPPAVEAEPSRLPTVSDRILTLLDHDATAVVVCLDRPAERAAWRAAQARPERLFLVGAEASTAILDLLEERGLSRSPVAVREALRPVEPPVGTYPFPSLRRSGRPRVVSIVSNVVDGDSRVQKVAASLAELGYESILLGRHPREGQDHYLLGGALVIRLPVPLKSAAQERAAPPRTLLTALAFRSQAQVVAAKRHARAEARRLSGQRSTDVASAADSRRDVGRRWVTAIRVVLHSRNRERFLALRGDESIETAGRWHRPMLDDFDHWARADDLELGFGTYVEKLRPDIIHAHDADMLWVAMTSADRLRAAGHPTRVVYDAHEYTPGIARYHSRQSQVLTAVERRLVPGCDAVITVSTEIADLMVGEHNLARRPAVILNAPTSPQDHGIAGVRQLIDVPDETPILVYVGGVARQRGVDLAVAALQHVECAHLVVVAPASGQTDRLFSLAAASGVAERMHRVDYVQPEHLVSFIASCDVGLIPFRPLLNSELGLPTKFREYLVAGLPVVASNQGLVGQAVARTGVGVLFEPGNSRDLARAVNELLDRIDDFRSAIVPDLVEENLWDRQVPVLQSVYAGLAPAMESISPKVCPAVSVLIGRANAAGQGTRWADALRRNGIPASNMQLVTDSDVLGFAADISVREDDWRRASYRLRAFVDLVPRHTHALVEGGQPLFGHSSDPLGDVDALQRSGLSVGLVFHGSDIRRPLRHAERERWSPFGDPRNAALTATLNRRTSRLHAALATFDGPVFVRTPDLLDDVPYARWLPVVVDTGLFCPDGRDVGQSRRPVVVRFPSHGPPGASERVDHVLRRLDAEGVITFLRFSPTPHPLMPSAIGVADIIVDQIEMNLIGVTAVETMASGRVVVGHLDEGAATRYPSPPPVVDATPATLEAVVRRLAADPGLRRDLAQSGRKFAEEVHDGRRSALVIAEGLGLDRSGG